MITRREVLVGTAATVLACRGDRASPPSPPTKEGNDVFTASEVAFILWLADVMIPPQDGFGGAVADPVAILLAPARAVQAASVKRQIARLQAALAGPPMSLPPEERLRAAFGSWPVEETEESLQKAPFAELVVDVRTATFHAFYQSEQGWRQVGHPGPPLRMLEKGTYR